jgi:hypothetical protein
MPRYFSVIWTVLYLLFTAYVAWVWIRWFRLAEKVTPKWRSAVAVSSLLLATLSTLLSVFLFVHAAFTGGYPFMSPPELFFLRLGLLSGLLGLIAAIVGKGRLLHHVAIISVLNLLLWLMDAMGQ